jgi:hypothetical protein
MISVPPIEVPAVYELQHPSVKARRSENQTRTDRWPSPSWPDRGVGHRPQCASRVSRSPVPTRYSGLGRSRSRRQPARVIGGNNDRELVVDLDDGAAQRLLEGNLPFAAEFQYRVDPVASGIRALGGRHTDEIRPESEDRPIEDDQPPLGPAIAAADRL